LVCRARHPFRCDGGQGDPLAGPFDWLITPYAGLLAALESDCTSFLAKPDELELYTMPAEGAQAIYDRHANVFYMHDFPKTDDPLILEDNWREEIDNVRSKYKYLADRFMDYMSSAGEIVFIVQNCQDNVKEFVFDSWLNEFGLNLERRNILFDIIKRKFRDARVELVTVTQDISALESPDPRVLWSPPSFIRGTDEFWDCIYSQIDFRTSVSGMWQNADGLYSIDEFTPGYYLVYRIVGEARHVIGTIYSDRLKLFLSISDGTHYVAPYPAGDILEFEGYPSLTRVRKAPTKSWAHQMAGAFRKTGRRLLEGRE
jgi:hypothetical protein